MQGECTFFNNHEIITHTHVKKKYKSWQAFFSWPLMTDMRIRYVNLHKREASNIIFVINLNPVARSSFIYDRNTKSHSIRQHKAHLPLQNFQKLLIESIKWFVYKLNPWTLFPSLNHHMDYELSYTLNQIDQLWLDRKELSNKRLILLLLPVHNTWSSFSTR